MSRKFIAAVLAISVTITGLASAPARASDAEDIAKVLGTVGVLYLLGQTIANAQEDRKIITPQRLTREDPYDRHRPRHDDYRKKPRPEFGDRGRHDDYRKKPRPESRERDRYRHMTLPASCIRQGGGRHGETIRVFDKRCVEKRADVRRLPQQCETRFRNMRGEWRKGYTARCVRRQGFQIARNR